MWLGSEVTVGGVGVAGIVGLCVSTLWTLIAVGFTCPLAVKPKLVSPFAPIRPLQGALAMT